MQTAEDYDLFYEVLRLRPGGTLEDIRRAHRKLVPQLHSDKRPGSPDGPMQEANIARDMLLGYWKKYNCAPPSARAEAEQRAREQAAQAVREKARREEAARESRIAAEREQQRRQEAARAMEEKRKAEIAFSVPPFQPTLINELFDYLNSKEDWWIWISLGGLVASLVAASLFAENTFGRVGIDTGLPTFVLWVLPYYLCFEGVRSQRTVYLRMKRRSTEAAFVDASTLRQRIQSVFEKSPAGTGGRRWIVTAWQTVEADVSQMISARLVFTAKILWLVQVHYSVEVYVKCKAGANPSSSQFIHWFEYKNTIPWAGPVKDIISELDQSFRRN